MEEVIATLNQYKPGARIRVAGGTKKLKDITRADLDELRTKFNLNLDDAAMADIARGLGHNVVLD